MAHTPNPADALATAMVSTGHYSNPTARARAVIEKLAENDPPMSVQAVNARLIIQAVNTHADLLAACREFIEWDNCRRSDDVTDRLRELMEAAIRKAGGE